MDLPLALRRAARQPLLQCAVIGALLFAALHLLAPPPRGRIAMSPALLEALDQDHLRRSGRPPTAAERAALLDRYVEQEALYREALALGLDRGDVIVRRRLVQKMQFVLEGEVDPGEPSEAELSAFHAAHAERYTRRPLVDLTQVFVDRGRRGAAAAADLAALRARLLAGADPASLGDPHLHGAALSGRGADDLAALFGADGAAALLALPIGQWSEPLVSAHGLHLVRIDRRRPGEQPRLADVRATVAAEWRAAERARLAERALARLLASYTVDEPPAPAAETAAMDGR